MEMTFSRRGQMTIEFVVFFPVALIVALIAVNALLFFSECAHFDALFREAVCTYGVSPAYGQGVEQSCSLIEASIEGSGLGDSVEVAVGSSGVEGGLVTFTGTLSFRPTLFGSGTLDGAFGVAFPPLEHDESMTVSAYKPGVIL